MYSQCSFIHDIRSNVSNVYATIQTPTLPSNFKDFAIRVIIFEVTFYIIISIIGVNIIYAIVVDTFIELREEVCSQIRMYVENYFMWQLCINMYLCTYFLSWFVLHIYRCGKSKGTINRFVLFAKFSAPNLKRKQRYINTQLIHTVVWKFFNRKYFVNKKFKVKYFCGYKVSLKYFTLNIYYHK